VKEMKFAKVPVSLIIEADYNPRVSLKPGDFEYERLKVALKTHGLVDPLVWNEFNGVLIGGHQRLNILKNEFNQTEVWCSVVHIEDKLQEKALNIGLNKNGGSFDNEKLRSILTDFKDFEDEDELKQSIGFSQMEFNYMADWTPQVTTEEEMKVNPEDAKQIYEENTIKQIVLYFDLVEYNEVIKKLAEIRERHGFEDNTSVFLKLLEVYQSNANVTA
jgi:hypothetical protein